MKRIIAPRVCVMKLLRKVASSTKWWNRLFLVETLLTGVMCLFGYFYRYGTYTTSIAAWIALSVFASTHNSFILGRAAHRTSKSHSHMLIFIITLLCGMIFLNMAIDIIWVQSVTTSDYRAALNHDIRRSGSMTLVETTYYNALDRPFWSFALHVCGCFVIIFTPSTSSEKTPLVQESTSGKASKSKSKKPAVSSRTISAINDALDEDKDFIPHYDVSPKWPYNSGRVGRA
mgnify:CR=1 FL=1